MAEKRKNQGLGDFYCAVGPDGRIFIPVRMREAMGIAANDEVKFSFQKDGKAIFSRDAEASRESRDQGKKDEADAEKRKEALK